VRITRLKERRDRPREPRRRGEPDVTLAAVTTQPAGGDDTAMPKDDGPSAGARQP
jgi:hypothetical protein